MPYKSKDPIPVTQPFLPPLEEVNEYLAKIWESKWLTNYGPFHKEFEKALAEFLGVPYVALVSNGTLGLVVALQVLKITGEVITTPFSFVATTHSLWWNNIRPVFVDIEPDFCNLDPDKVESAITPQTTAIMPVHVYGHPCQVDRLQEIADIYGLHLIYDAAHAFGVKLKGQSIVNFGDLSVLSFHATKLFHTVEGGAIVTSDDEVAHRIEYMRNFGHKGQEDFWGLGINGKNSEMHAAMGLAVLPHVADLIERRMQICDLYDSLLKPLSISRPVIPEHTIYNYSYYPVLFESESILENVVNALHEKEIYPRRYFYPSLNTLPYVQKTTDLIAEEISRRVLCLPLCHDLDHADVRNIVEIISRNV